MRDEILTILAILVLSGAIVYGYKQRDTVVALDPNCDEDVIAVGGAVSVYNDGPQIYVAQTPYLFQAASGSVLPARTATPVTVNSLGNMLSQYMGM